MDSTYIILQHYWWFLVSLLGALLVFLLFVQGGQSLLFTIGKTELQQKMLLNSTGRKWEFTFTTLVTFGGAFFASFPLFYSTSFGGAYWVWMLILACFVLQAVSYEYQSKKGNLLGKKTYQVFLLLNGILAPVLLGTAIGTFFSGAEFVVDKGQLTDVTMPVISTWATPWHGLEAAFVFWNVCLGMAVFFLARIEALLYFINNIDDAEIVENSRKHLVIETGLFLVFFLVFLIHLLLADGFAVDPETKEVYMQPHKYFTNLIEMPAVSAILLAGIAGVLYGIIRTLLSETWKKGIWFCGFRIHRPGPVALCRLEQYGLLSFSSRPAKFADDREQLFQPVHFGSDELCFHPHSFRPGLYFLCLACIGSTENQRKGDGREIHTYLLIYGRPQTVRTTAL